MNTPRLEIAARLVEAAVDLAEHAGHLDRSAFFEERDALYGVRVLEARERAVAQFYRRWFEALELGATLHRTFAEYPCLALRVERVVVAKARRGKDEGAELFASDRGTHRVGVQLLPQTLLDRRRLIELLRPELLAVDDMLDPSFGYAPTLPDAPAGQTHVRLLIDRYSALWRATIVGRLVRSGRLPDHARGTARAAFDRAFPMFGDDSGCVFAAFFEGPRPPHRDLVAFSERPRRDAGSIAEGSHAPGERCPLCGLPSYALIEPGSIAEEVVEAARADSPSWSRKDGICAQCAELYHARRNAARRELDAREG